MSTVQNIFESIESFAPSSLAMDYDNVGILVGDRNLEVQKSLITLDCTSMAIQKAIEIGANLIITHHPVIFNPIKRVNEDSLVLKLISNGIALISAHTNLDIARGGVNDCLASAIGLKNVRGIVAIKGKDQPEYLCRIGDLSESKMPEQLAKIIKQQLNAVSIKYADAGLLIKKLAICSGAGGDEFISAKLEGADALLTGEVKHDQFIEAVECGVTLIEAGHFDTEDVVIEPLKEKLSSLMKDVVFETYHYSSIKSVGCSNSK